MNVLVFNIKTIPDIQTGQKIFDLEGLDDVSTIKAMKHLRQQHAGTDFMPLHLHKIIAISVLYRGIGEDMEPQVSVHSLGQADSSEAELLELLIEQIEERTPTLISWNGSGFDFPVIHYRMLKNKMTAPSFWLKSDNNYLARYHQRHIDLMTVLASYNDAAKAPLDHIAAMLGFPKKTTMDDTQILQQYQSGHLKNIHHDCETGVLNTYLVYLRFQLMNGELKNEELQQEYALLRQLLDNSAEQHLQQFSKSWG